MASKRKRLVGSYEHAANHADRWIARRSKINGALADLDRESWEEWVSAKADYSDQRIGPREFFIPKHVRERCGEPTPWGDGESCDQWLGHDKHREQHRVILYTEGFEHVIFWESMDD